MPPPHRLVPALPHARSLIPFFHDKIPRSFLIYVPRVNTPLIISGYIKPTFNTLWRILANPVLFLRSPYEENAHILESFFIDSTNDLKKISLFFAFFKSKRNPGAYAVQNDEETNYQIG